MLAPKFCPPYVIAPCWQRVTVQEANSVFPLPEVRWSCNKISPETPSQRKEKWSTFSGVTPNPFQIRCFFRATRWQWMRSHLLPLKWGRLVAGQIPYAVGTGAVEASRSTLQDQWALLLETPHKWFLELSGGNGSNRRPASGLPAMRFYGPPEQLRPQKELFLCCRLEVVSGLNNQPPLAFEAESTIYVWKITWTKNFRSSMWRASDRRWPTSSNSSLSIDFYLGEIHRQHIQMVIIRPS